MKMMTRLLRGWPTLARDLCGLIGAGLVAYGVGLIYTPAGVIVLGLLLMAGAVLSARAAK